MSKLTTYTKWLESARREEKGERLIAWLEMRVAQETVYENRQVEWEWEIAQQEEPNNLDI